jgi:hypothetical protein
MERSARYDTPIGGQQAEAPAKVDPRYLGEGDSDKLRFMAMG